MIQVSILSPLKTGTDSRRKIFPELFNVDVATIRKFRVVQKKKIGISLRFRGGQVRKIRSWEKLYVRW